MVIVKFDGQQVASELAGKTVGNIRVGGFLGVGISPALIARVNGTVVNDATPLQDGDVLSFASPTFATRAVPAASVPDPPLPAPSTVRSTTNPASNPEPATETKPSGNTVTVRFQQTVKLYPHLIGRRIDEARLQCQPEMQLQINATPRVNGQNVPEDYIIQQGDSLEFIAFQG